MKYVILIHANPNPWGHPTGHFTDEGRRLDAFQRLAMDRKFDELMEGMAASGELVVCEALADPGSSTIYRWKGDTHVATEGPYAETKGTSPGSSSSTSCLASVPRRSGRLSPTLAT